jgi:hypothetical protein
MGRTREFSGELSKGERRYQTLTAGVAETATMLPIKADHVILHKG